MTWAAGRCSCRARSSIRPGTGPEWCSTWAGRCASESCASRRIVWRLCSTTRRVSRSPCSRSHSSGRPSVCPGALRLKSTENKNSISDYMRFQKNEWMNIYLSRDVGSPWKRPGWVCRWFECSRGVCSRAVCSRRDRWPFLALSQRLEFRLCDFGT